NFTTIPGEDLERFDIVFQENQTLTNQELELNNMLIYNYNEYDKLYIEGLDEDIEILKISNILGQAVKTYHNLENSKAKNGIDISYLSSGIYIVNVESGSKKESKKIIVD
ncbi:MAG: T9SS type A sorting domain-containing protein, partial [Flavobacteriaceae bacterium]|nr:T9SS type A sorting domain-containing protein [Flavobacteriaceae bacterium]